MNLSTAREILVNQAIVIARADGYEADRIDRQWEGWNVKLSLDGKPLFHGEQWLDGNGVGGLRLLCLYDKSKDYKIVVDERSSL